MKHPKEILKQHSLVPKKSLGQNFLFDENVLRRIVDAAQLLASEQVLEIGPGLGALTKLLAQTAAAVTAVELDDRFLPILEQELSAIPNVKLIHGDILDQDLAALFPGPFKVVANVPYYITGAILRHLLSGTHKPLSMVLTVQKEVAQRLTAVPPRMSLLAVSVQLYGKVTKVTEIKAGSFWPPPDVDSAVIHVALDAERAAPEFEEALFHVARAGFSQKRKQLQKNLRQLGLEKKIVAGLLERAAISGRLRAETLTLAEWRTLTQAYLDLST